MRAIRTTSRGLSAQRRYARAFFGLCSTPWIRHSPDVLGCPFPGGTIRHAPDVLGLPISRGCTIRHAPDVLALPSSRGCTLRVYPGLISIAPSGRLVCYQFRFDAISHGYAGRKGCVYWTSFPSSTVLEFAVAFAAFVRLLLRMICCFAISSFTCEAKRLISASGDTTRSAFTMLIISR